MPLFLSGLCVVGGGAFSRVRGEVSVAMVVWDGWAVAAAACCLLLVYGARGLLLRVRIWAAPYVWDRLHPLGRRPPTKITSAGEQKCVRVVNHGVNFGTSSQLALAGAVPDARRSAAYCAERLHLDVSNPDAVALCDDDTWTPSTSAVMFKSLRWLADDLRPGDIRIFRYSGHGVLIASLQARAMETCLLPIDAEDGVPTVSDQDMIRYIGEPFRNTGATALAVCDSCYSGPKLMRLRHCYEVTPMTEAGSGVPRIRSWDNPDAWPGLEDANIIYLGASRDTQKAAEITSRVTDYSQPVGQADTAETSDFGALTDSMFDALDSFPTDPRDHLPSVTVRQLILFICDDFSRKGLTQRAQLCTSRPIDLDARFVDLPLFPPPIP
jgi:Caspase domain